MSAREFVEVYTSEGRRYVTKLEASELAVRGLCLSKREMQRMLRAKDIAGWSLRQSGAYGPFVLQMET